MPDGLPVGLDEWERVANVVNIQIDLDWSSDVFVYKNWVNDSDLTQLVLEMPVDVAEVSPVDVRVYFAWYASGGFVYLDPAIELVKL